MTRVNNWEAAWAEYVDALAAYDLDWSGPDFVIDIGRVGRRLNEAKQRLRSIDENFCNTLCI